MLDENPKFSKALFYILDTVGWDDQKTISHYCPFNIPFYCKLIMHFRYVSEKLQKRHSAIKCKDDCILLRLTFEKMKYIQTVDDI